MWGNYGRLAIDTCVVDDSHFIVQLRRCHDCSQRFLCVFTEFVDWDNGEDAQYRQILPVTEPEARAIARWTSIDLAYLSSLGRDRRYLKVDWPSDHPNATATWSTGEFPIIPRY